MDILAFAPSDNTENLEKGKGVESTDIVVKQTGREGCLHTVEIQTEIQV